jgi:predicted RNase H-like nuclease (RuvC/YqgF family)
MGVSNAQSKKQGGDMKRIITVLLVVAVACSLSAQKVKKIEKAGNNKSKINYEQEYHRLMQENDQLRSTVQAKQNEVNKLRSEIQATNDLRNLNAKQREEITSLKDRINKLQTELNTLHNQKQHTEKLVRALEHENAKLKAAQQGKAIKGKDSGKPRIEGN